MDFILYFIIYPQHCKEADRQLKQLLRDENSIESSVDDALKIIFKLGHTILKELVESILQVSKSLISNLNDGVHSTAAKIYKLGLGHLDSQLKRDFIDSLIDLITSSNGPARDNCLEVLADM